MTTARLASPNGWRIEYRCIQRRGRPPGGRPGTSSVPALPIAGEVRMSLPNLVGVRR